MIVRLLQFVFIVLLFRFLWRLVALAWGGRGQSFPPAPPPREPIPQGEMVRDPVCGVYILRERAIEERRGGELLHFCSEQCRTAFRPTEASVS